MAVTVWTAVAGFISAHYNSQPVFAGPDPGLMLKNVLSADEIKWLKDHPVLRVAGPADFPPFHFYENPVDAPEGLSADYLKTVADQLGIRIQAAQRAQWPVVLEKAEKRQIDLISCAARTKTREAYLRFSDPYLSFPMVIISRKDETFIGGLRDLTGKKVACVKKSSTYDWLQRDHISIIPHFVSTPTDGLRSVSVGRADAHIENLAAAVYLIEKNGLFNLKVAAPTAWGNYELYFAVRRDWPELVGILNKALAQLPAGEKQAIRNKWLSIRYEHGLRKEDIAKWIGAALAVVLPVVLAMLFWNRRLKKEIDLKTQAQLRHQESERQYRALYESSRDGYARSDLAGRILECNTIFEKMVGYSKDELAALTYKDITPQQWQAAEQAIIQSEVMTRGYSPIFEKELIRKNGAVFPIEIRIHLLHDADGKPAGFWAFVRDITEKDKLQQQLQQAQKLEAIGTLAGGIAHDFNNLLMGIQGNVSLALTDVRENPNAYEKLANIEGYIRDATQLTKQLLGIGRGGKYEPKPTHLNVLIEKCTGLFGRTRKEIQIEKHLHSELDTVVADRGQIEQVLLNLFVNAAQAMPAGGRLTITTEVMTMGAEAVGARPLQAGRYVLIRVQDTGIGMDKSIQERIFDPFFTTKGRGRGTGLGLSSAYGIIANHNGFIEVDSEVGAGSVFTIYLPASDEAVESRESESTDDILMGKETVLLVDDEEVVLEVGQALLDALGYTVIPARSGRDAVETYRKEGNAVDIVILDLIMPDMSGAQVYNELKNMNPDIKVMLSSGYSRDGQAEEILQRGCQGFIQKPFTINLLSQTLRRILD